MPSPKEHNLILLRDSRNQPKEIHIKPLCFPQNALREIVRLQIFNSYPVEIAIIGDKTTIHFSAHILRKARRLFGKERKTFLDVTASAMRDAKKIIIRNANQR